MSVAEVEEQGTEPVEPPEPGDDPEPTPEPEDEPADPEAGNGDRTGVPTEKEVQSVMDRLGRETERHAKRISEIMGEDALQLARCPMCDPGLDGFYFPRQFDDETKEMIRRAIGDAPEASYLTSPDAQQCPACDGLGKQLTGSKVPEHITKPCGSCRGAGWLDKTQPVGVSAPQSLDAGRAPIETDHPSDIPEEDFMGRKRGDPLYGIMPGYEAGR